jgi:hypothetical protein
MTDGWTGPRPVLVGVGGLLLVAAGVVQLLIATLYVALFGATGLLIAVPMSALGVGDVLFGWRIRSGRSRGAALGTAFVTSITSPWTLSPELALATILCSIIAIFALVRYGAWFQPPTDDAPTGKEVGPGPS